MSQTFYNIQHSALTINVTIKNSTFSFGLAESTKKDMNPNDLKKGMKVYAWGDDAKFFAMDMVEGIHLLTWINKFKSGLLKEEKEQRKTFCHNRGSGGDTLLSFYVEDRTVWVSSGFKDGKMIHYPLKEEELLIVKKYLESFISNAPILQDLTDYLEKKIYNLTKNDGESGNRSGDRYSGGSSDNRSGGGSSDRYSDSSGNSSRTNNRGESASKSKDENVKFVTEESENFMI